MRTEGLGARAWDYFIEAMCHTSHKINVAQILFFSLICGVVGGLVASFYFFCIEALIELVWGYLFEALKEVHLFGPSFPEYNYIWMASLPSIIMVCVLLKVFAANGPGGFGPSADKIHTDGTIPYNTFVPMFFLSLFSLTSGSGVGPEAPILGMGGAALSYIGHKLHLPKRALRTFILTGVCACLSGFFGTPFSGLFGLEFAHRWGIEYFEAFVPSMLSSFLSAIILQAIFQRPFGSFFYIGDNLEVVHPKHALQGLMLGLAGAAIGVTFYLLTTLYTRIAKRLNLDRYKYFLPLIAWVCFSVAGMMVPPILFWGEPDFQNVLDLNIKPVNPPPHYPTTHWHGDASGIFNLGQPFTPTAVFMIALVKLLVLPMNVAMNLKGGIVFPLFFIGGTVGQLIHMLTGINQALAVCCVMAGAQASVTRTPFSSVFVAVFNTRGPLPQLFVPVGLASFMAVLLTHKLDLFKVQRPRDDFVYLDEQSSMVSESGDHLRVAVSDREEDERADFQASDNDDHFDLAMSDAFAKRDQIHMDPFPRHTNP